MKYTIISDVHANPSALERVLADAEHFGAGKVVCAGDVVGYGPDPAGAIKILRERGIPTVMGNHDVAVVGWRDTNGMIGSAREGTERHRRELGADDLDWLRSLPYVYENDGFAVAHANFANPHFMDYIHDGGFPEMQGLRNKRAYVQSLIEAILRKDIQKRFNIRNIEALRKLAHHLINNACQESFCFSILSANLLGSISTVD